MRFIVILFVIFFSACFNVDNIKILNEHQFRECLMQDIVLIDTRDSSFYNGFSEKGVKNGGHIKNALNITATMLEHIEPNKFESYFAAKGINKDKKLLFYGSDMIETKKVAAEFVSLGYKGEIFADFKKISDSLELERLKNYHLLVSPEWLYERMQSAQIFEVSWGKNAYKEHIKGAVHMDTDLLENAPLWNISDSKQLSKNLSSLGILPNKLVVLYSDNQMAAFRAFFVLKYVGVKDVRVLNGALAAWKRAGFKTESTENTLTPSDFKLNYQTNMNLSMPVNILAKKDLKLVSIRSWDEYIGKVSGYSYINKSGEIPGAIWGFSGSNSSNVNDYYAPDGTLRNPYEIYALWKTQGIKRGDSLAFYCGTGWRASVAWFVALLDGWENIYVYDGGWNAWQMDKKLNISYNKDLKKPDAKNDFGAVVKIGASCKS